eukprot:gene10627-14270_t
MNDNHLTANNLDVTKEPTTNDIDNETHVNTSSKKNRCNNDFAPINEFNSLSPITSTVQSSLTNKSLNEIESIFNKKVDNIIVGSMDCPFRLLIAGGGPAGCAIIIRAIRLGYTEELLGFEGFEATNKSQRSDSLTWTPLAGVCLVDKSPIQRLGGGRLQDYVINSNTYASKFVSNVLNEKLDVFPEEKTSNTLLEKLKQSEIKNEIESFGNHNAPLNRIGKFLCEVGAIIAEYFSQYPESSRLCTDCTIKSLHRCEINDNNNNKCFGWKVTVSNNILQTEEIIYTRDVCLSIGGLQKIPKLPDPDHNAKLIPSDVVCTEEGINIIQQRLSQCLTRANNNNQSNNKSNINNIINNNVCNNIVIVGGSHSAFSAAWICLNKIDLDNTTGPSSTVTASANTSKSQSSSQPFIYIIHCSPIQVFYSTKGEADHDGYTNIGEVNKVTGQIHPFGGLRGDAKELWKAIKTGHENRVRLVQIRSNVVIDSSISMGSGNGGNCQKQLAIVEKMFDEAVAIVWACGYCSNTIPIYDINGQQVSLQYNKGQVEINNEARIIIEGSVDQSNGTPCDLTTGSNSKGESNGTPITKTANFSPSSSPILTNNNNNNNNQNNNHNPKNNVSSTAPKLLLSSTTNGAVATSKNTNNSVANKKCSTLPGLYGCGLGYGFRVLLENGEPDGSSGRADGVAVYLKRGAALVLHKILGSKVFGGYNSWEERNHAISAKKAADLQQKIQIEKSMLSINSSNVPGSPIGNKKHHYPVSPANGKDIRPKTAIEPVSSKISRGNNVTEPMSPLITRDTASTLNRKNSSDLRWNYGIIYLVFLIVDNSVSLDDNKGNWNNNAEEASNTRKRSGSLDKDSLTTSAKSTPVTAITSNPTTITNISSTVARLSMPKSNSNNNNNNNNNSAKVGNSYNSNNLLSKSSPVPNRTSLPMTSTSIVGPFSFSDDPLPPLSTPPHTNINRNDSLVPPNIVLSPRNTKQATTTTALPSHSPMLTPNPTNLSRAKDLSNLKGKDSSFGSNKGIIGNHSNTTTPTPESTSKRSRQAREQLLMSSSLNNKSSMNMSSVISVSQSVVGRLPGSKKSHPTSHNNNSNNSNSSVPSQPSTVRSSVTALSVKEDNNIAKVGNRRKNSINNNNNNNKPL